MKKKRLLCFVVGIMLAFNSVGYCKSISSDIDATNIKVEQSYRYPYEAIPEVVEKVKDSVVGIRGESSAFFGLIKYTSSIGTGVIIQEDGYIVTNNHVIESVLKTGTNDLNNKCKIEVVMNSEGEEGEERYEAKVLGRDPKVDLAVLKIEKTGLKKVEFGDADEVKVGEVAIAIGTPCSLKFMGSVTSGIVSGLRVIEMKNGEELKMVQTDAAINPGNSGGALLNLKGELIGINTLKIFNYEGLGFAISLDNIKEFCDDLIDKELTDVA